MKPLNKKQRTKAFLIYALLFLITNALVTGLVYFNFQVPVEENVYLGKKIDVLNLKMEQQKLFSQKMNRVKSLIDTMNTEGISRVYIDELISSELAEMRLNFAASDSTFLSDLYNNVILAYLELKTAKVSLQEMKDAQSDIDNYVETIEKLNEKLTETERDLAICRQLSR